MIDSSLFIILLGMATTFFGLICIILLSVIMSCVCKIANGKTKPAQPVANDTNAATAPQPTAAIENRGEVVAAIAAAIAEEMGTDVSSLRIHSIRKI